MARTFFLEKRYEEIEDLLDEKTREQQLLQELKDGDTATKKD